MHKLSERHKQYLLRRQRRSDKNRQRIASTVRLFLDGSPRIIIRAPAIFSLSLNRQETIDVINEIRSLVINRQRRVYIDLSEVTTIGVAAALVLSAEIFRCKYLRPGRNSPSVTGNYPSNSLAHKILHDIGFFKTLAIDPIIKYTPEFNPDVNIIVSMQSFTNVDAAKIASFKEVFMIPFAKLPPNAKHRMQGAILEAILNSFEHAFSGDTDFRLLGKRAWLAGYINITNQEMLFIIFDQGVGIPRTIDPTIIEKIVSAASNQRLAGMSDGDLIQLATTFGRTSTGEPNRGKGFRTMRTFVEACTDGELRVYSNRGQFSYNGKADVVDSDSKPSLGGTLILLRIRHQGTEFEMAELLV